jgi:transketolase
MRNLFGELLANSLAKDERLWLLTGDLGFGVLNKSREVAPDRSYNVGAAEQLMLGAAVGLTHNNKIPICYSITPFVIFRPFEWIRNYLDHEGAPVKLVGAGRDKDYGHLGFSHWGVDDEAALKMFPNVQIFKPKDEVELSSMWEDYLYNDKPSYLNILRKA